MYCRLLLQSFLLTLLVTQPVFSLEVTATQQRQNTIKEKIKDAYNSNLLKSLLKCTEKKGFYNPKDASADTDGCTFLKTSKIVKLEKNLLFSARHRSSDGKGYLAFGKRTVSKKDTVSLPNVPADAS